MLLEGIYAEPQRDSLSMASGPSEEGRLSRGIAQAQHTQPPSSSQAQDDVQLVVSQTPHVVTDADARMQQDDATVVSFCEVGLATTSATLGMSRHGATESSQQGFRSGSPAADDNGEQGIGGQGGSPADDSDSEDDIQVRAMDRTALLSSLVGSGTAEGAIESLVASLKY